jgi:hypothetical protein
MTRAELVEKMARAIHETKLSALQTTWAHWVPEATAALAAIEAAGCVVVPARGGITAQMEQAGGDVLTYAAINAMMAEELHPDDMVRRIYRAMLAASPLAKEPGA